MKTLNIYGDNRFAKHTKIRKASRGIVLREGKILLTYEVNTDQWFIPGGGMEAGETEDVCCIRELAEETGYMVKVIDQYLTINEYYEEWLFVSHYFICELTGSANRNLTEREMDVGLEPRWISIKEAMDIFSRHQDYASENEMKRGAYLREYNALLSLPAIDGNHI